MLGSFWLTSCECYRLGLKIAIADVDEAGLGALESELKKAHGEANVIAIPTDVSNLADVQRLRDRVYDTWGEVRSIHDRHFRTVQGCRTAKGTSHVLLGFCLDEQRWYIWHGREWRQGHKLEWSR
jgi:hypothetical protein